MSEQDTKRLSFNSKELNSKSGLEFQSKQYIPRNSLLTDLYDNAHTRSVLNIFIAILVGQFCHSAATEWLYKGRFNLGVDLIQRGLSNLYLIILIWMGLFISTVLVYFFFKLWAAVRIQLKPKAKQLQLWDTTWISVIITYYVAFLYCGALAMIACDIKPAGRFGLTCEIFRLLMKTHAYIRSNAPRVLNFKPHSDEPQRLCPEFSKYMYFLWAPTLLYRDEYPRTHSIRWKFIANHLTQLVAVVFFSSFIFEKYIINVFEDFGRKQFVWKDVAIVIIENAPAGAGLLVALFFTIQHAWMNVCAEILMFADRLFYKDWWTAACFGDYYRTWNLLVQDWLYTYIYKDFYEIIIPRNKTAASYVIFFISAVAHEYITGLTFGFFMPIVFILFFGFGTQLAHFRFMHNTAGNVFVLYSLAIGMSINSAVISIEYFYRQNCPVEDVTFASYLIPRFITCNMHVSK